MANNDSSKRLLAIAAVVVVVLLAIIAFLLYNKVTQDKVIDEQYTELAEADKLRIEMDKQYHQALSELEEMRTGNEELNAIIDQQKVELKGQRDRIDKLLKGGGSLDRARAEIRNLTAQVEEYIAQIDMLKAENEGLKDENYTLTERTRSLSVNLDSARAQNQGLSSQNQQLSSEKERLAAERARLSDKVTIASVVKVKDINVIGLKERSNGKTVKKKSAKNVDQLRICFQTTANEVTNPGVEQFFVRIINPIGETMAIDELSSGVLIDKATGDEVRYSSIREYDYNNDETEVCFNWDPEMASFQRGNYQVEIYNKGHLAGTGTFSLK